MITTVSFIFSTSLSLHVGMSLLKNIQHSTHLSNAQNEKCNHSNCKRLVFHFHRMHVKMSCVMLGQTETWMFLVVLVFTLA